ncbi:MAG: hypothetical protein LRZ84_27365 [Desertifilum sp.]|nr:hypothetical protein [Desertifilum sp.]
MQVTEIQTTLETFFGDTARLLAPGSWQVETPDFRLLVLLSDDRSWLRLLIPILPAQEALPFLEQWLEENFDATQETRYALNQNVLWGVYQHSTASLAPEDFQSAIARLLELRQNGLSNAFDIYVDRRIRSIILAAKQQGQSLESTLQTLNRFYEEGVMGELSQTGESRDRILAAWQRRLESLWSEVEG